MVGVIDRLAGWYIGWRMHSGARQIAEESGIQLHKASIDRNGYSFTLVAPNLLVLLDEACALLDKEHAENYIQFDMLPWVGRTGGRAVRVTLQWRHGESPAEQNARLRAEVEKLRAELAQARGK